MIYDKDRLRDVTNTQDQMYLYYILKELEQTNALLREVIALSKPTEPDIKVAEEVESMIEVKQRGRKRKVVND